MKEYTNISSEELTVMLESPPEYYDKYIMGFNINLDYYIFADRQSDIDVLSKDILVIIICNSGNRSASAAEIVVELGFSKVYNLENYIANWDGPTI